MRLKALACIGLTIGCLGFVSAFSPTVAGASRLREIVVQIRNNTAKTVTVDAYSEEPDSNPPVLKHISTHSVAANHDEWLRVEEKQNITMNLPDCGGGDVPRQRYGAVTLANPTIGYPWAAVGGEHHHGLSEGESVELTLHHNRYFATRRPDDSHGYHHAKVFTLEVAHCSGENPKELPQPLETRRFHCPQTRRLMCEDSVLDPPAANRNLSAGYGLPVPRSLLTARVTTSP